jgi:hypothetical protein
MPPEQDTRPFTMEAAAGEATPATSGEGSQAYIVYSLGAASGASGAAPALEPETHPIEPTSPASNPTENEDTTVSTQQAEKVESTEAAATTESSETTETTETMDQLLEQFATPDTGVGEGQIFDGHVLAVTEAGVIVDVGGKFEGLVPKEEFLDSGGAMPFGPGQTIESGAAWWWISACARFCPRHRSNCARCTISNRGRTARSRCAF